MLPADRHAVAAARGVTPPAAGSGLPARKFSRCDRALRRRRRGRCDRASARGSGSRRSTACFRSFPRMTRRRSSSSRTASSRTRAGRPTRSPTSRAARPTSRGTTASTGTTRRTSVSARRRTRSPPRKLLRRPGVGGTNEARRAGRDDSRRVNVRSRRRNSWVRRTWRRRRCFSACAPRPGSISRA